VINAFIHNVVSLVSVYS